MFCSAHLVLMYLISHFDLAALVKSCLYNVHCTEQLASAVSSESTPVPDAKLNTPLFASDARSLI